MSPQARSRGESAPEGERGPEQGPPGALRALWDQVGTLVLAVLIALGIRAFVIEPFRIPSGSMLPTLLIGDHLFVNKFAYGIKIPFSDVRLPGLRQPERGDVVVFSVAKQGTSIYPADERPDFPRDNFVKRIVGLPGDTVEVRDGEVRVNGQVVPDTPTDRTFVDDRGRTLRVLEEQLGTHRHAVLDDPALTGLQQPPTVVPAGRYFVMGDNRDFSNDSRGWGTVRLAEMKGPAFVLYWSWDFDGPWSSLLSPLTWYDLLVHKARWSRIGERVE
jgi:signal peptidase I